MFPDSLSDTNSNKSSLANCRSVLLPHLLERARDVCQSISKELNRSKNRGCCDRPKCQLYRPTDCSIQYWSVNDYPAFYGVPKRWVLWKIWAMFQCSSFKEYFPIIQNYLHWRNGCTSFADKFNSGAWTTSFHSFCSISSLAFIETQTLDQWHVWSSCLRVSQVLL